jgi:hypothetical protein
MFSDLFADKGNRTTYFGAAGTEAAKKINCWKYDTMTAKSALKNVNAY